MPGLLVTSPDLTDPSFLLHAVVYDCDAAQQAAGLTVRNESHGYHVVVFGKLHDAKKGINYIQSAWLW